MIVLTKTDLVRLDEGHTCDEDGCSEVGTALAWRDGSLRPYLFCRRHRLMDERREKREKYEAERREAQKHEAY